IVYCLVSSVIFIVREGSSAAAVYEFGLLYNILIPYFFIRGLFTDIGDIKVFLSGLVLMMIPLATLMGLEAIEAQNSFSAMCVVRARVEFRDGHYRCQGPFRSTMTAGTFGATFMPLFAMSLYLADKRRPVLILGFLASTLIMIFSHSSGPLLAYVSAVIGLL